MLPIQREKKATFTPRKSVDYIEQERKVASVNTQDKILSKALHDFIVPLIQSVVEPKHKIDIDQSTLESDTANLITTNLITALKDLISNVIRNSAGEGQTKIEINLDEEERVSTERNLNAADRRANASLIPRARIPSTAGGPQYTVKQKLHAALRDHVFNRMPIRLLSFEQRGSMLQIVLLERSEILMRLETKLRKTVNTKYPKLDLFKVATRDDEHTIEALIAEAAKYAILSHTWLRSAPGEVTYGNWMNGRLNPNNFGYQKLVNFCRVVSTVHKLTLGWMDTICINKDSSSELDESIRSMYKWYERADVCIIYLAETYTLPEIHHDPWFTRGWTLQELLAPNVVKFYNRNWSRFVQSSVNDKKKLYHVLRESAEIHEQIYKATTISTTELVDISRVSFSRRMQLAANRKVTREEDMAYSLMGIFNVNMATAYGEGGKRAFSRLLHEISNSTSSGIWDLFNWAGEGTSSISQILPASPQLYCARSPFVDLKCTTPLEPLTLTHMGIRIPVLLMPGISVQGDNPEFESIGDYTAVVNICPIDEKQSTTYHLLDRKVVGLDGYDKDGRIYQCSFAVFNIEPAIAGIHIPQICIAIPITCEENAGYVTSTGCFNRIYTKEAVVFKIQKRNSAQPKQSANEYVEVDDDGINLAKDDLARHGMQLVFKYF